MNVQATATPSAAAMEPPRVASPLDKYKCLSGFEGREGELGQSMSILLKILGDQFAYAHQMNDPLVKAHLLAIQFAKNHGMLADYVAHDIKTMEPVTRRMKMVIEKTGNPEIGLIALFDRTACHYALAMTSTGEGRSRTWQDPFEYVLTQCRRIGQFDLTPQEIHETWTTPRLMGYAASMGIKLSVSAWRDDGTITCTLAE